MLGAIKIMTEVRDEYRDKGSDTDEYIYKKRKKIHETAMASVRKGE